MRNRYLIGGLVAVVLGCSSLTLLTGAPSEPPPPMVSEPLQIKDVEWTACTTDDECVAVPSVCEGFFWSVNTHHMADNEAQNNRLKGDIGCGPPPRGTRPLRPICQAHHCLLPQQP